MRRHEVLRRVAGNDFTGFLDGAFHAFGRLGQHQFGAQCLEYLAAFDTHGRRHGQHQLVATGGGHEGQADAGIAGGGFDDGHARLEFATTLGIPDHVRADPALDRVTRVAPFDLGQNGHTTRRNAIDLHQRRVADGVGVVSENAAHGWVLNDSIEIGHQGKPSCPQASSQVERPLISAVNGFRSSEICHHETSIQLAPADPHRPRSIADSAPHRLALSGARLPQ
ncbi:hypothetical protein D3C72_1431200 [compost metagenome]